MQKRRGHCVFEEGQWLKKQPRQKDVGQVLATMLRRMLSGHWEDAKTGREQWIGLRGGAKTLFGGKNEGERDTTTEGASLRKGKEEEER